MSDRFEYTSMKRNGLMVHHISSRMRSKDLHPQPPVLNQQRLDERFKNANLLARSVHFCEPSLDGGKGIWAYGNNPIDSGMRLIAMNRLQVVVKGKSARSLNEDEACCDIPLILWAEIDDAIDLSCGHKSQ